MGAIELNFRDRRLLDLAYRIPCTLRLPGCIGTPTEPCHSNRQEDGKGMSIKASDATHVAGCRPCHLQLDSGATMDRAERQEAWLRAYARTMRAYIELGLLKVVA